MKKGELSPQDLGGSVISVPPMARTADFAISPMENAKIVEHLRGGGVSTYLYGGNANLYNQSVFEYGDMLDMLESLANETEWFIPSIGPDFGKLMDQASILSSRDFPTAMVLPADSLTTQIGVDTAIRRSADRFGRSLIIYLKQDGYLSVKQIATLIEDGAVWAVKYAIPRKNAAEDNFLRDLVEEIGADIVVSGFGEQPAVAHLREFGLQGFTSGCVCIAPTMSNRLLMSAKLGDWNAAEKIRRQFAAMEAERDRIHPIRTLHDAIALVEIADTGPMLPLMSGIPTEEYDAVRVAAVDLLRMERQVN